MEHPLPVPHVNRGTTSLSRIRYTDSASTKSSSSLVGGQSRRRWPSRWSHCRLHPTNHPDAHVDDAVYTAFMPLVPQASFNLRGVFNQTSTPWAR